MTDTDAQTSPEGMIPRKDLAALRLIIGLAQGLALWQLLGSFDPPEWTRGAPWLFTPLLLVWIGVPVVLLGGVGQMRWKWLLAWAGVATVALALLGLNDALRVGSLTSDFYMPSFDRSPSPLLLLFGAPALFIAHHLAVAADADRRVIASYPRYFDIGWTSAAQVAMGGAMIGALWIILWIGALLFSTLGIELLRDIITKGWFAWPVTCVAFAMAIQLTDDRAGLVRGMRTLALVLLSWLMPVMTLFVVLFLIAIPFTGLEPLWRTGSATAILLAASAAIVALINAAWQDGEHERTRSRFLQVSGLIACATIAPLVLVAGYSLWLRIDQYGFTPDRVAALVAILIAAVYAAGYLASLFPQFKSQLLMQRTNVAAAFVCVMAFLAVFSPIADPARISVEDQVARLLNGRIKADSFDFNFLRWQSARYGQEALAKLSTTTDGPEAARIAELAANALKSADPYDYVSPVATADRSTVWPQGRKLPDGFPPQDAQNASGLHMQCTRVLEEACDAILVDIDRDGAEEILLVNVHEPRSGEPPHFWSASFIELFRLRNGAWILDGRFDPPCRDELDALKRGEVSLAPREVSDLMLNGQRLALQADYGARRQCR